MDSENKLTYAIEFPILEFRDTVFDFGHSIHDFFKAFFVDCLILRGKKR